MHLNIYTKKKSFIQSYYWMKQAVDYQKLVEKR